MFQCVYFFLLNFIVGSVTIYGWESMIPLGFLAATGYVVACCKSPFIRSSQSMLSDIIINSSGNGRDN
jgi:hypothetical protein